MVRNKRKSHFCWEAGRHRNTEDPGLDHILDGTKSLNGAQTKNLGVEVATRGGGS